MKRFILSIILTMFITNFVCSQNVLLNQNESKDSLFVIGNIGFFIDSMDVVLGDVPRGEKVKFPMSIQNIGNEDITFINGKSNMFVSLNFNPVMLHPNQKGVLNVEFESNPKLDLGDFITEIAIICDDKDSPYKFLNLVSNIVENNNKIVRSEQLDSVPNIVFDHYNYYFGHFVRGRRDIHTYIVSNNGGVPLVIDSIVVPKGITVVDKPHYAILPGEEDIIRVKINTHGRVGVQHESILVYSNDPVNSLIILGVHGSVRIVPSNQKAREECGEAGY